MDVMKCAGVRIVPLVGFFLALFWGTNVSAAAGANKGRDKRPNIIFIIADDFSYLDISCFGQKEFSTPNIDRLTAEGRVFRNAYTGAPWCAPSRTSLLTGMNGSHFNVLERDEDGRATRFNPTVGEMLKAAGYATGAIGKWHMFEGWRDSWIFRRTWEEQKKATNWKVMPWNRGFDYCRIGYRGSFMMGNGNPYFPFQVETGDNREIKIPENYDLTNEYLWRYVNKKKAHTLFNEKGHFVDMKGKDACRMRYSEDIYREEAVKFMRKSVREGKPFYLHYASPLMHGPLAVKDLGRFKDKKGWSYPHKIWAAMVEYLDGSVGRITEEVRRLGIADNTLIFFASDNGYSEWGYFRRKRWTDDPIFKNKGPWNRGKFITTNGGVIVPLIAWCPGRVPSGTETRRAVNFYDFMATASELAGAKLLGPTDGVSVVPLLEGRDKDQPLRKAMPWFAKTIRCRIQDNWAKVRDGKSISPDSVLLDEKWFALLFGKTVHIFDIVSDPGMTRDLAGQHPDLCARARAQFQKGTPLK